MRFDLISLVSLNFHEAYVSDSSDFSNEGVTLPLSTTVVFVGRRSWKNEEEHNRCYSDSMTCE